MRRAVLLVLLTAAAAAGSAAAAGAASFRSPSGNIGCYVVADAARCDVGARSFRAPARPRSCDLEWGDAIGIGRRDRRGSFSCHGDTARDPKARTLAYGRSIRAGSIRCSSRMDGVRCVNGRGHGFFVSKQAYRLF